MSSRKYGPAIGCAVVLCLMLAGCSGRASKAPAIGQGYAGPANLTLRQDLGPRSPTTAVVNHGDRLEIIARRRRFVKVRTEAGVEGWTDSRLLLSPEEMAALRRANEEAMRLPSQGTAYVYDTLNIHTEPSRQSPSLHQIKENERVEVIGHRLAPRSQPAPPATKGGETVPVPMDDWSLVRTADKKSGWALSRMLVMAIPDEVAQYAEGHRITSYFSLGTVKDGAALKHNWLWTTSVRGQVPYEFDSFRVFVWSVRRHRYETAYIERNLKGYYPVTAHLVELPSGTVPGFSLVVEEKDGSRVRRTYAFQGYHVRLISRVRWEPSVPQEPVSRAEDQGQSATPSRNSSLWERIKESLAGLTRRWFSK